jgi:transcriptional regulator with XRE-family HTH domain
MDSQLSSIKMKKMGLKLAMTRQNSGYSLAGLSRDTGIDTALLAAFEQGAASPSLPQLENLATTFGRSIDDFISEKPLESKKDSIDPISLVKREKLHNRMIGLQIKKHRLDQNISVDSLAQACGITLPEMEAYESGLSSIPFMTLVALCHELGISIGTFITTQPSSQTGTTQVQEPQFQVNSTIPVLDLPQELLEFVNKPVNLPFVELAQKMSQMDAKKLRQIAESILEITL